MRKRVQDLVRLGDSLFSSRRPIETLWQTSAENFHVMRADFTRRRYFSEEFGSYLMTGRPARCHRDLSDSFSSVLRRDQWFHAKTDSEIVNEDRNAKVWLDWASKTQRLAMYDRRAGFVRAAKIADGDFCAFGNAVVTREMFNYSHFLYRTWHLRDVCWDESVTGEVNTIHFHWKPQARQLVEKFGKRDAAGAYVGAKGINGTIAPKVLEWANSGDEQAFTEIRCRRVVLPADDYDLDPRLTRGRPWVSVYVDCENETVLEEVALRTNPVTIPRWAFGATLYGQQYAYSPALVYGLPDGRMMQQVMLSLLEASEKATNPPMIAVGEAINGAVNIYASGITQTDADYDERTGEVLRPITLQLEGIQYGEKQLEQLASNLDDTWYLSKIRFPEITKEMTAYEANRLWEQFIRETLPLFEPVQESYNEPLCDGTFEDMLHLGAFGALDDMPQILHGRDIGWQFDTPITVAAEKALTGAFQAMVQTLVAGAEIKPDVALNADMDQATRDAIDGAGAPAKWLLPVDQVKKAQAQKAQQDAEAAQAEKLATGADTASKVATAAHNAGRAAQAFQGAGMAQ
jgi:hypothetical protein